MNRANFKRTLQERIDAQDQSWSFSVKDIPKPSWLNAENLIKFISVTSNAKTQEINISLIRCPPSRVTSADTLDKFILISFADFKLRFPSKDEPHLTKPATAKESAEYIARLLQAGVTINGIRYHFYGHSNSQLKSRSCYLFAGSKEDISRKVEALGDFSKIKTVAKKAKRIGLLFSTAELGVTLPPERYEDIPDIQNKDYNFTDGCGLIATSLAKQLVKHTNITFRNRRYTPTVFQIRYRGYKGVLTIDPSLRGKTLVQFRDSMRKFKDAVDLTLSVVDYSKPYGFGYLNDEVILLLNSLGITTEILLSKQTQYLAFLSCVSGFDPHAVFQFLCFCNRFEVAERLLLDGVESVQSDIRKLVKEEQNKMLNKRGEQRCRIFVQKSRLLFGICDPRNVLREGECFVRITMDSDGEPRTLTGTEVLVTRNPCLHPGDLQKFKAVGRPDLSHLVDCIVFPTRGKRPSADLMSGGDLDGDKFFVCWDRDLIPSIISQPATYPGVKEPVSFGSISDDDRAKYFAGYTSASLGQIKNLYLDWAKLKGPMSAECQQLNRLFSQCVDGNRIKVPDHLKDSPKREEENSSFILDVLHEAAKRTIEKTSQTDKARGIMDYTFDALELLLSRDNLALSEFELIQLTMRWCDKNGESFSDFVMFFDFTMLNNEEKAWTLSRLPATKFMPSLIMNGLMQSNIISQEELRPFKLHYPVLRWKRVFDSNTDRMGIFLDCTARMLELFHKKLIILRIDERLSVAIYIPKKIERHSESQVDSTVRVFAFPHSQGGQSPNYTVVPTKVNYRLFCDSSSFQLYQGKRANTWIFLQHGPSNDSSYRNLKSNGDRRRQKQRTVDEGVNFECRASIALDKISKNIQTHMGRVNRQGILGAEIYVISNRDVKALRMLDLWLEFVDTQETIPLFERNAREYSITTLRDVDWNKVPEYIVQIVRDGRMSNLDHMGSVEDIRDLLYWLLEHSDRVKVGAIYEYLMNASQSMAKGLSQCSIIQCLLRFLPEVPFLTCRFFSATGWDRHKTTLQEEFQAVALNLLRNLILSAHSMVELVLEPIRIVLDQLRQLPLEQFSELMELIALTVRPAELALDLFLEHFQPESSRLLVARPKAVERFGQQLYGIALDHIDEATESKVTQNELLRLQIKCESKSPSIVESKLRIDAPFQGTLRIGDHVRFTTASPPQNAPLQARVSIDAIVETAERGIGTFRCLQPLPQYLNACDWKLQNCGSFTSSKTMLDAVTALYIQGEGCCKLYRTLVTPNGTGRSPGFKKLEYTRDEALNDSQNRAIVAAMTTPLSLLWGPPGTGKTRTVVAILQQFLKAEPSKRILVAAPTHNAVDNILRKFVEEQGPSKTDTVPIRVSTDVRRVSDDLKTYTCDAMLGKDLNTHFQARSNAQKRIKECRLAFTTCIGANLGLLRGEMFQIVLIDEASQQTEAMSLVPLVKGCERAVLVGDHVQLRATIQQHAKLVDFDISLFERMYGEESRPDVCKVMLDTQYRMHRDICSFSSAEFYGSALGTAVADDARPLPPSMFPWPMSSSKEKVGRKVFIQCSETEDLGRKSKSNRGQALLCREVCKLLATAKDGQTPLPKHSIAILTPYTRQLDLLKREVPGPEISSIDGYQGREADIVVFVTVRCNAHKEMGFLKDMRRLNVAMTRAKAGVIIIGDRATLSAGDDEVSAATWNRLIKSCVSLDIKVDGTQANGVVQDGGKG